MASYTNTRPRGFAPWNPRKETLSLLAQIQEVLVEYADYLPLTIRQVFYRLVGKYEYPKDENAYSRLCETLNRARRAGYVPFDVIRDDGMTLLNAGGFSAVQDFWSAIQECSRHYHRDRQQGQPQCIEVWCEAAGMSEQLFRVTDPFGVSVYSSSGFDSTTTKHDAYQRIVERVQPTVILHVGDYDPSGVALFDSLAEDISAFCSGEAEPVFVRAAVTEKQIDEYALPSKPAKPTDRRGGWKGGTVQAEALDPAVLAEELESALLEWIDLDTLAELQDEERAEREQIVATLDGFLKSR